MILSPDVEVLVATINSIIVSSGYARIEPSKPYLNHQKYAYSVFMFTHPDHRGKRINSKIIDSLKEWCRSQNIMELHLDVYNDNPCAIKAYEKVGFKKHLINRRVGL